ncbi:MAG: bifunctional diaminohydroxyphosphoribosylaminopyrimidine deaminase/5-amino-6-(5-phosphoribosylamino)uracil reductase RibD [Lentisphaerae bacterium]|nr:bifunctional diaminohydroxyphosphoribosylaminopyrimidine deaminase/5-amino-6-(5-phosphoribosylamino)uracil reductase RibD [Lentisphaerota bacterium]
MDHLSFHKKMMQRALNLAEKARGFTAPNPVVGAVIVKNGKIIGEGWHHGAGQPHAEVEAIRSAGKRSLKGADIYVTLEPCCTTGRTPPCTSAIINAGISRVFAGCTDSNGKHAGKGFEILRAAGITVETGILEEKCLQANRAFFHHIQNHKPFVILKMASTLDGKIATVTGNSQWITSELARKRVQKLRKNSDAIIVGAGTYRQDHPSLTIRTESGTVLRTPLRFVATAHPERLEKRDGWEYVDLSTPEQWNCFLEELGKRGVMQLLIEGGGTLAASALAAKAVNEIEFHYAPKILGGAGSRTVCDGENPEFLSEAIPVAEMKITRCGVDFVVTGKPVY